MRRFAIVTLAVLAFTNAAGAQSPARHAFSAQDALDLVTLSVADVSSDGRWVAATAATRRDNFGIDYRRDGDPTYVRPSSARLVVIDAERGTQQAVFPDKRNVRAMRWSPNGAKLGMLLLRGDAYEPVVFERANGKVTMLPIPAGRYVAEASELAWSRDGASVLVSLHTNAWRTRAQARFDSMTRGPVFVQTSVDPFLDWDGLRRDGFVRSVVSIDVATKQVREVLPEALLGNFDLTADGRDVAVREDITKKTDYDVIFGREEKLVVRPVVCAAPCEVKTVFPSLKGMTLAWAMDGRRYAYSKDGKVFVGSIDEKEPRQVAGPVGDPKKTETDTSKAAKDQREKERFSLVRFSPTGDAVVASNKEGLWLVDPAKPDKRLIIASNDSNPEMPRVAVTAWTEDGSALYLTSASRTKWSRAVLRYDVRDIAAPRELVRDDRIYTGIRPSRDGKSVVLSIATGNRPAELYAGDGELRNLRRISDVNPQLQQVAFGATRLIDYLDADGHRKYGVVYLPANYESSRSYPTVFSVYEDFFDDSFDATAGILTGAGYVVVKPSVDFEVGHPGEAWVKGVTAAANKLIELGIADSAKLGVQGVSYGGYATNLLVTQTNRFKAAINISGKVDLVSFYTDSPRLGVRNVHAAEKSQDRIGATLWQQPQKYVEHSAIFFADRITTPLMLMTGAQDSNVPADNTREMYYALRRLGKEVVWVNYMNGGHGGGNATVADFLDMQRRMVEWYDTKLKGVARKTVSN
ncbi:MAG: prolyl oligopeptidase family serine peptidase [Gemmatimonadaceae bacterium]